MQKRLKDTPTYFDKEVGVPPLVVDLRCTGAHELRAKLEPRSTIWFDRLWGCGSR
jgi:hypothetical protein